MPPEQAESSPILEWEEPIYFLDRKNFWHTKAVSITNATFTRHWIEAVSGTTLKRTAIMVFAMVVLWGLYYMYRIKDYTLKGIVTAFALAASFLAIRLYRIWGVILRGPGIRPARIRLTANAIELISEDGEDGWSFDTLQRAQVGTVQYEDGQRKCLRIKVRGEGWCEFNIAPQLNTEDIADFLRAHGVRVQETVKRRWYE